MSFYAARPLPAKCDPVSIRILDGEFAEELVEYRAVDNRYAFAFEFH